MDELRPAMAEATDAPAGIPLDLAPLLAPFARHKELSLRIERLPDQARLSRGRNNGDRTWSLTPAELDGLRFLPPEGMDRAQTLAVRIFSLDGDYAATLALIDFPVAPGEAVAKPAPQPAAAPASAADPRKDAEIARLRDELASLQAILSDRETELVEMRHRFEQAAAEGPRQQIETKLNAARAAWEAELQKHLAEAAAEGAVKLEQSRASWQAEQATKAAQAEAQILARINEARIIAQQEAASVLGRAEAAAKAGEAVRLAAAEKNWREQSARALAAATAKIQQAEASLAAARAAPQNAHDSADQAELARLRDALASVQATLSERETELIEARQKAAQGTAAMPRQALDAELAAARKSWDTELQERVAKVTADAATKLDQSRAAWQAEQAEHAAKAEAQTQDRAKQLLAQAQQTATLNLARAQASWQAAEAARLAAAETQWREQSAQALAAANARAQQAETALAAARAQPAVARDPAGDAELRRLGSTLAATQIALTARDAELAQARSAIEAARAQMAAAAQANLAGAQADAKAGEAARLAAAEAQWREQLARVTAEATARVERAEVALATARAQFANLPAAADATELQRLRDALAAVQAALFDREAELAQARTACDQAQQALGAARAASETAQEAAKPAVVAALEAPPETKRKNPKRGSIAAAIKRHRHTKLTRYAIRGGAVAASLVVATMLYTRIEPVIAESWWPNIVDFKNETASLIVDLITPATPPAPEPVETAERPAVQLAERRTVVAISVANVRAGPSPAAPMVATLPREREVSPVERRGSWVLIRFAGEDANHIREGWVFSSSLKETDER